MNAALRRNKGSAPYPLRYRRTKPVSRSGIHSALRCSRRRGKRKPPCLGSPAARQSSVPTQELHTGPYYPLQSTGSRAWCVNMDCTATYVNQ